MKGAKAPADFHWDVLAMEVVATMSEQAKHRGLPSRVCMQGFAIKEQAERLRRELEKRVAVVDEKWNKDGRRRFTITLEPGKGPNAGYDVSVMVEDGKDRIVVRQ